MFGFPKIERAKDFSFPINFLKSATIQIVFPPVETVFEHKEKIEDALKEDFQSYTGLGKFNVKFGLSEERTPIIQEQATEKDHGLVFQNKEQTKRLTVAKNNITLQIEGDAYSNFEDARLLFKKALGVQDLLGIKKANRIAIRKVNIVDFELIEKSSVLSSALQSFFNPAVVKSLLAVPPVALISKSIVASTFEDGDKRLNLAYGLMPKLKGKSGQLILDIDMFRVSEKGYPLNKAEKILAEINAEVFNVFNWMLNDKAITELQHQGG